MSAQRTVDAARHCSTKKETAMFKRARHHEPLQFPAWDILAGLAPALVEDLAHLVGSTEEDLRVTFQMLPYGDRATLAAYRVLELGPAEGGRRRVVRVEPAAVELVNAAAELLAGVRSEDETYAKLLEPRRAFRSERLVSDAVPIVPVVQEPAPPLEHQVHGRIVAVDADRVTVEVPIQDGDATNVDMIQIAPDSDLGDEGALVILMYKSTGSVLSHPQAVAPDHLVQA